MEPFFLSSSQRNTHTHTHTHTHTMHNQSINTKMHESRMVLPYTPPGRQDKLHHHNKDVTTPSSALAESSPHMTSPSLPNAVVPLCVSTMPTPTTPGWISASPYTLYFEVSYFINFLLLLLLQHVLLNHFVGFSAKDSSF